MGSKLHEYLDAFIQDAEELLQDLDDNLLALEKNPGEQQKINRLFRIAHTLKGNSGLMGFNHVKAYTHALESVISLLRSGKRQLDEGLFDVLFTAFGFLRETIQYLKTHGDENTDNLTSRTRWILDFVAEGSPTPVEAVATVPKPGAIPPMKAREDLYLGDTIRVNVGKLDLLLDAVGELVLNRTQTLELVEAWRMDLGANDARKVDELMEVLQHQGRILGLVQEEVMKVRMIPIQHLFERCPRIARDVASKLGKKVELDWQGSSTELDKKMIDALSEPLLHLINNAVAHGIETPEERRAAGKPAAGLIKVGAYNEHNQVVVTIEDDGQGIDADKLERLMSDLPASERPDAGSITSRELFDLLARPGVSSAEEVTEISGRGVGLDVVRSRIEGVNGSVEMFNNPGVGTRFVIRLPLTLAIIQAVLVRYRGVTFAVPQSFVQEILMRSACFVRTVEGRGRMVEIREEILPLVPLDAALKFEPPEAGDCPYLVIAGTPEHRVAVPVEELCGDREVVVKTLNPLLGVSKYISGAAILGDGKIVLILDIFAMFKAQVP